MCACAVGAGICCLCLALCYLAFGCIGRYNERGSIITLLLLIRRVCFVFDYWVHCRLLRSLLLSFLFTRIVLLVVAGPRDKLDALLLLCLIIIMLVRLLALIIAAGRRLGHGCLLMVLVEEVALEHGLRCRVFEVDLILLDGLGVLPLLIIDVVLIEIIVILTR